MSNTTLCTTTCPKRLNATIETNSTNLILCSNNKAVLSLSSSMRKNHRRPTPHIPAPLLGSLLAPFLPDRQTFNNFILSCHEIYQSCRHIPAPWPCKQVACDGVVQAVTFSPSGELLAYTSDETVTTLLNRQTGERTKLKAGSKITSLAFAPNGQFLASGQRPLDNEPLSNDNIAVCVWDLRTACLKTHDMTMGKNCQELYRYGGAHSVSISPDGKILASGGMDQTVHLWKRSYSTDGETVAARFQYQRALTGLSNWIYTVKFSPNGKYLAAVGEGETSVWLWSIEQDYDVVVLQDEGTCHKETIHCIDFSANGKYLVSGSDDETIRVWDLKSLSCHKVLEGNCCPVWTLACSPWKTHHSVDNTLIVSGGKDQDTGERVLRLWSLETGKTDRILRGYLGYSRMYSNRF
ncbi:WD40 repeat-containing protein [Nitzschia inconspicua]|uniref:WD40 repeat-containing protein n=1 Tax=Nitzschia inconspicua TaxID=303405 RepID=A0A9K3K6X3_9STRA|nr:WD40 repeat-containing protein [Nitzschia inconspicua]